MKLKKNSILSGAVFVALSGAAMAATPLGCGSDSNTSFTSTGGAGATDGGGATGGTGLFGGTGGAGATGGSAGVGGATGGTGGGDPCPGATLCGSSCTNTNFDPANCGSCGNACPSGQLCSSGQCSLTCLGGTTQCGTECVNTNTDSANCGTCANACTGGQVCSAGQCGLTCVGGTTLCNGACVNTGNDTANCGSCGNACPSGQVCAAGQCALSCVGGTTQCGNSCVNTTTDPANCGTCGTACTAGQVCDSGTCSLQCSGGSTKCGNSCVDTNTSPTNCGTCGAICPGGQVCSGGSCQGLCSGGLTQCGNSCVNTQTDGMNCGTCGNACASGATCQSGTCVQCNSATTDCDGDGWLVSQGDCCDKPGLCGNEPALVNPGAIEVVGNGLDDNCNGLVDLFDTEDTLPCDTTLTSNSSVPGDYAKALGICKTTTENPPLAQKTWGLISAEILRADGSALGDVRARSIRNKFGNSVVPLEGGSLVSLSSGIAADATQTNPGPNGGAPGGGNVSTTHAPASAVNISTCTDARCIKDWFQTANPPLKAANALPVAPNCGSGAGGTVANDSVMLRFRLRAPTNVRAFSFNSYFLSAEYPEFVCSTFNDQLVALVDTPGFTPSPIANPVDKNLMTYLGTGGTKWPIGINVAAGTNLFAVCQTQAQNPGCWDSDVAATSCQAGPGGLLGTGFEKPTASNCLIGGGTFWLTTAGNVVPGQIVELRIVIWDVGDSAYDSVALLDGFRWLANATLPGTG